MLHQLPVSPSDQKGWIQQMFINRWQKLWGTLPMAKHTKLFLPTIGVMKKLRCVTASFDKGNLSLLTQVVSGHEPFRGHVGHWREEERLCCSLCLEDTEMAWHLWRDCPALELEWRDISSREGSLSIKLVTLMCQVVEKGTESGNDRFYNIHSHHALISTGCDIWACALSTRRFNLIVRGVREKEEDNFDQRKKKLLSHLNNSPIYTCICRAEARVWERRHCYPMEGGAHDMQEE